jgi:broad specificity phosphatase PhoE
MEIYLLRHGVSTANERQLVCGASDYPLSEKGGQQAIDVCVHLNEISFDRIYTSPLSRAKNTIQYLDGNISPVIANEIKELNTGAVSHITLDNLWAFDIRFMRPWLTPNLRYPSGETFNEMVSRITQWYEKEIECWSDYEKILIVGHEGTLRSIYLKIFNLEMKKYPDFKIGNCDYLYFKILAGQLSDYRHIKFSDIV